MNRRQFVLALGAGAAAPICLRADTAGLQIGGIYSLRCLGDQPGLTYLDGHTHDSTVGLVKALVKPFSGTKWRIVNANDGAISFECKGDVAGKRWLDGRTVNGTVGLAPNRQSPFTGTRWLPVQVKNYYLLKCLGAAEGPRFLDGRTHNGSVGLAKSTDPPFTGTRWEIKLYPHCIDEPCPLP